MYVNYKFSVVSKEKQWHKINNDSITFIQIHASVVWKVLLACHIIMHRVCSIHSTVYRNKILISGKLLWCKGNKTFWEVLLLLKYCIISYKVVPCTPLFLTSCKSPFIISAHPRNITFTTLSRSKKYFFLQYFAIFCSKSCSFPFIPFFMCKFQITIKPGTYSASLSFSLSPSLLS